MESIRILQDTYEKLYALSKPIAEFLQEHLPCISPNWKSECVDNALKTNIGFSNDRIFEQLDVYYLLVILLDNNNWNAMKELFSQENFFSRENKRDLERVRAIRNTISHPKLKNYTTEDLKKWNSQISYVATLFKADLQKLLENLHKEEKGKLLAIINENVILPALACETLDADIKTSILGTQKRLEVQNTAAGIIAFFDDALRSRRGKRIYEALKSVGLKGFEDITDIVKDSYYGFSED